FHASVRSRKAVWYIDPYYNRDEGTYASYYVKDLENVHAPLVENEGTAQVNLDHSFYRPADTAELNGTGFAPDSAITVTFSDANGVTGRSLSATADATGAFTVEFVAEPNGNVGDYSLEASDDNSSAIVTFQVLSPDDLSHDPAVGAQLRT